MKKVFSTLSRALLIGLIVLGITPARLWAADVDDAGDAHALGPYDEVSCNGAFEDELDTGDPNEDFFPPFSFKTTEQHDDGGGSFMGQYEFPFTDEQVMQKFNRESEAGSEPAVNVSVVPTEIQPGENVTILATAADFRDSGISPDKAFAVAFSVDEISLQGIQAGGKSLPESPSGSSCGIVTRTPQIDQDGDGMDDTWETVHGLNPSSAGDAGGDPDGDSAAQFFSNADDEPLEVTPETAGGLTGEMTNLAEYIWDTDPRDPDTDRDSITDGQEIIGFGGPTVTFANDRPVGSSLVVRAYVVGVSLKKDATRERASIVKLDASLKTVHVTNGEHLRGRADPNEVFTQPGGTVLLTADFEGTQAEPDSFAYTYIIDGQEVENPSTGRHQLEVTIEPERQPGEQIPYEIQAVNPHTGQLAILRGVIRVGEEVQLQSDPPSPVAGASYTVHAVLTNGSAPDDYLFEWHVNGLLDQEASGIGRDSITLIADDSQGSKTDFEVELYAANDNAQLGQATLTVSVAKPEVTLQLVPEEPVSGDTVSVIARPSGFAPNFDSDGDGLDDATLLKYRWIVDGQALAPDETAAGFSTITFNAGEDGSAHTISVDVRTTAGLAETAGAQIDFTASVGSISFGDQLQKRGATVAATLLSALPQTVGVVLAAVMVFGSLLWISQWQRRRTT
jgi:hypothetical protein